MLLPVISPARHEAAAAGDTMPSSRLARAIAERKSPAIVGHEARSVAAGIEQVPKLGDRVSPGTIRPRPMIATASRSAAALAAVGELDSRRGLFVVGEVRVGAGRSLSTTCKFKPPIPNALTAAVRGRSNSAPGHGRGAVATSSGMELQSTSGFKRRTPIEAGIRPCFIANTTFKSPASPAVSRVWPMLLFTLPIGILRPGSIRSRNTLARASISVASPTWVLVAWVSTYCTSSSPTPLS